MDPFTELPYRLPGRVFRSAMPFSSFDPGGKLLDRYREEQVSVVVLLVSDENCWIHSGRDLRSLYQDQDLTVIYLPIPDFGVPERDELERDVTAALGYSLEGKNIAIHCQAGIGRTGTFAACLAKRTLGLTGDEAIVWVRQWIRGGIETFDQEQLVRSF
ncbi:MAG TPA: protein-tyrosine phosphatase family protein [Anaerolineales bacterium]|nr:protein-tyrosine phosphatase family protein [Anaerolineales bacterium]